MSGSISNKIVTLIQTLILIWGHTPVLLNNGFLMEKWQTLWFIKKH